MKCLLLLPLFVIGFQFFSTAQINFDDELDFKTRTAKSSFQKLLDAEADTLRPWKFGFNGTLTISQTQVTNWQAGGVNNLAANSAIGLFADYRKGRHYWLSLIDASYGLNRIENGIFQKLQDYFEVNTKYGYRVSEHFSFTVFSEMITQFTDGFDYKNDPMATKRTSAFFAPAFLNEGIGLVYDQPKWGFYSRFAPFTARQILILENDINPVAFGVDSAKNINNQFGASLRLDYLKQLVAVNNFKLSLESRLSLFGDYAHFGNFVTNWRNKVNFNVYKVFTFSLIAHLIYDPNVLFPNETQTNPDGTTTVLSQTPKVQFLQNFGFGIGYTITGRR